MRRTARRESAALLLLAASACVGCILAMHGCAPLPSDNCAVLHECPIPDGAALDDAGIGQDVAALEAGPGDAPDALRAEAASCGAKSPHDDPCVVDERFGVFVSPVGNDSNPGTRALPLSTLGRGMDVAHASGKPRVFACAGSFAEELVVGASRDGVAVYGGFDCTAWSYGAQNQVMVAPARPGYVLDVEGLTTGATFEDLELVAQDANAANAGESSIAVFVAQSQHVALHRVSMRAANAAGGAAGVSGGPALDGGPGGTGTNWLGSPPYAALNGNDALGAAGAPQKMCVCPDRSVSVGGRGGGSSDAGAPMPGIGSPLYDVEAGVALVGRNSASCGGGGAPVQNGFDAPSNGSAAPSQSWGSLTAGGWTAAVSVPGAVGSPGQGGGGGGNGPGAVGGGGSGACGGCGGAGGKAGSAGGSTIALVSFQSAVDLVDCSLAAGSAGSGGAGGDGEPGQPGSLTAGNGAQSGCQGGLGGAGAGGNGGQGGAGGLSLGIGYVGTPPTFDGTAVVSGAGLARVTLGVAGIGGRKGARGNAAATSVGQPQSGTDGAPGFAGIAQAVLGF